LRETLLLAAAPVLLIGFAAWHRSLLSAVPAAIGVYIAFLVGLFLLPTSGVVFLWLFFGVVVIPLLWWRFPGQYTATRSLTSFFLWPVLATIAVLAEKDESFSRLPDEVPGQISGKVDFIETAGLKGDYIMVFLAEFGDTAFYCDASLESRDGLVEDAMFVFQVDRMTIDELGDDVLWLTNLERVTTEEPSNNPGPESPMSYGPALVTVTDIHPVSVSWELLEEQIQLALGTLDRLRVGARPEDIQELEETIDSGLPEHFRESLVIHDGQEEPMHLFLVGPYRLWPISTIIAQWKDPYWTRKGLLPFADDGGSTTLMLHPAGGSIIETAEDGDVVLFESFGAFLSLAAKDASSGKLQYDDDAGSFFPCTWPREDVAD